MGLTTNCTNFLFFSLRQGVEFNETLMLGRQHLYAPVKEILKIAKNNGLGDASNHIDWGQKYSEPLFKLLGAKVVESLDYSDFEGASVIHDLNFPVPAQLKSKYSVVFDGGTLEHVFNFPQALDSCIQMIRPGGHFISITPVNNQCGHGFYQLSPELFFSVFSPERGFKLKKVLLAIDVPGKGIRDWYEVSNPKHVGSRVTISNEFPTYVMVLAQRVKAIEDSPLVVYQSDYLHVWHSHKTVSTNTSVLKTIYKSVVPISFRNAVYTWRSKFTNQRYVSELGNVNPAFFKKVEEDNANS